MHKKFLVEILGMTNYCNLDCRYCDWEKKQPFPLSGADRDRMRTHIRAAGELVRRQFPEACLIEYSGGEPYLYPEIVGEILEEFSDFWVRIVTNGTRIGDGDIQRLKNHGKAFLAISLDGMNIVANSNRFRRNHLLESVISAVDRALKAGIPVMLLCTLNAENIDDFCNYLGWLSRRYERYILAGMLVLPAHILSQYAKPRRMPSSAQWNRLKMELDDLEYPIYTKIREHYDQMFMAGRSCTVYQWAASLHFLDQEIIKNGIFTSYVCGMRGVYPIGSFSVERELEDNTYTKAAEKITDRMFLAKRCGCFVDWVAFDLILKGVISPERAQDWFVLFRDEKVRRWIKAEIHEKGI